MAAATPFAIKLEEDPAIPLECRLCPKNPKFSDISHLLTHVSSKSHLHKRFQTQIEAKSDQRKAAALRQFEEWYAQYDIESLLAERMAAKDLKNRSGRRSRANAGNNPNSRATSSHRSQSVRPETDTNAVTFDGRAGHLSDWDPRSHGLNVYTPPPNPRFFVDPGLAVQYTNGQAIGGGGTTSQVKLEDAQSEHDRTDVVSSIETSDHATDYTGVGLDAMDEENRQPLLKGQVWPGMDLFDAATPDQKRKRNQRKDDSVIEQMKVNSQAIMAIESIWNEVGDLGGEPERCRDIYATPSIEGSPPPPGSDAGDSPVKKRRAIKQDIDTDASTTRVTRSAAKKAAEPHETPTKRKRAPRAKKDQRSFDVFPDPKPKPKSSIGEGYGVARQQPQSSLNGHYRSEPVLRMGPPQSSFEVNMPNAGNHQRRSALEHMDPNTLMTASSDIKSHAAYVPDLNIAYARGFMSVQPDVGDFNPNPLWLPTEAPGLHYLPRHHHLVPFANPYHPDNSMAASAHGIYSYEHAIREPGFNNYTGHLPADLSGGNNNYGQSPAPHPSDLDS